MEVPTQIAVLLVTAVAWQPLVHGIGLGMGAAIPIGPVNVEIARRVLRHGFRAGVAMGMGAVTVDVIYVFLSTLSFVKLLNRPAVIIPVAGCGMLLLAYLGIQCIRAARTAWRVDPLEIAGGATDLAEPRTVAFVGRSFATGFLMTLLNPMTLAFWFTVVPAMGAGAAAITPGDTTSQAAGGDLPMMGIGVFIGTLAWVLTFSTLMAFARRATGAHPVRRRRWIALADFVGGIALLGFAVLAGIGFWRQIRLVL